jgi:hypothetical protein
MEENGWTKRCTETKILMNFISTHECMTGTERVSTTSPTWSVVTILRPQISKFFWGHEGDHHAKDHGKLGYNYPQVLCKYPGMTFCTRVRLLMFL